MKAPERAPSIFGNNVHLADDPRDFRNVRYVADITSGDLYPEFPAD